MSYRRRFARLVCSIVVLAITSGAALSQTSPEATEGKEAVSKDVLTGNVQKQQKNKKKQKEMFVAGTTTLPAGRYKMINRDTNIEYVMTVDETGKMTVNDVKQHQNPPATTTAPTNATPAPSTAAVAPNAAATAAQGAAATTAATAAPTDPASQTTSSKLGSLIKREAAKQFARHGSKIETKIRHAVKGKL